MPSKISYSEASGGFNATVFRKNITRNMPLWLLYALAWFVALTLPVISSLRSVNYGYDEYSSTAYQMTMLMFQETHSIGTIFSLIIGCLASMAIWNYLYTPRSAGTMAALPIKRESLFLTNYLSGAAAILAVHLLVYVITAVMMLMYKGTGMLELWYWFLRVSMSAIFFYSFGALCAMVTGNSIALPVIYVLVNFAAIVVEMVLRTVILPFFFFGIDRYGDGFVRFAWLTPTYNLMSREHYIDFAKQDWRLNLSSIYSSGTWGLFAGHLAVGLVLAGIALMLYRSRHIESAGDFIAVPVLRPVFKYVFALGCAVVLGALMGGMYWSGTGYGRSTSSASLSMTIFMLCGGVIGYYAAEMMLKKSARVWRSGLRGAIGLAAVVLAICCALAFDAFGVEGWVPKTSEVLEVRVDIDSARTSISDAEGIDAIREVHALAIGTKDSQVAQSGGDYRWINIYYTIANSDGTSGKLVYRSYPLACDATALRDPDYVVSKLNALFNSEREIEKRAALPLPLNQSNLLQGRISYFDKNADNAAGYRTLILTFDETVEFYNQCVRPDMLETSMGMVKIPTLYDEPSEPNCSIEFEMRVQDDSIEPQYQYQYWSVRVTADAERTLNWLRERGVEPATYAESGIAEGKYQYSTDLPAAAQ